MNETDKTIPCFDLGIIGYNPAWELQQKIFEVVSMDKLNGVILLLEHNPVITIGNNRNQENILSDKETLNRQGIELIQSNRGGDVTFHGPGQLICYPVFDLNHFGKDVGNFVYNLEQVVIDVLADYKIKGTRIEKLRGVFVGSGKIASIGIHVKKWITYHGFSFNVNVDLGYFNNIIACGLKDYLPVSLEKLLTKPVSVSDVKELVIQKFEKIFSIEVEERPATFLDHLS
jgi:lipoyl(octanoyl) transferase